MTGNAWWLNGTGKHLSYVKNAGNEWITAKFMVLMESRIHWKVYVRFGGEHLQTRHSNMEMGGGCLAYDIRSFVRERADSQTYKQFEKANQLENQPWKQKVAEGRNLCLGYFSILAPQFSSNSYAFRLRTFR